MKRDEYIAKLRERAERLSGLAEHQTEGKRYEVYAACLSGSITALRSVADDLEAMDVEWVPRTALDWLLGKGPDEHGEWFDQTRPETKGALWWRTTFRRKIEASHE